MSQPTNRSTAVWQVCTQHKKKRLPGKGENRKAKRSEAKNEYKKNIENY